MRVLVGCEESGVVSLSFSAAGHEAMSCDLMPSRGAGYHITGDIIATLNRFPDKHFDIIILHPPCTALTVAGNKHYGIGKPKHWERKVAIGWTEKLWAIAKKKGKRVCLENPVSVLATQSTLPKPVYVHPWQFGHKEMKKTALFLHNLPELVPTNIVGPPPTDKEEKKKWEKVFRMAPGENRARDRSVTYSGIAEAMAEQWGRL